MNSPTPGERIAACAYRHWKRAGMTEWPTVAQVCRRLRIRQSLVEECEGDGYYMLTAWNVVGGQRLGENFVEANTPEVEREWAAYWARWTHQYGAECAS